MKGNKIIIISIIINILTIGIIYNFIKKDYLNNEKIIVKAMTEGEYENNITSLNISHEDYAKYVEESKTKIASALTDRGVTTSAEETLETMANNIKSIARDGSFINNDNKKTIWCSDYKVYALTTSGYTALTPTLLSYDESCIEYNEFTKEITILGNGSYEMSISGWATAGGEYTCIYQNGEYKEFLASPTSSPNLHTLDVNGGDVIKICSKKFYNSNRLLIATIQISEK